MMAPTRDLKKRTLVSLIYIVIILNVAIIT